MKYNHTETINTGFKVNLAASYYFSAILIAIAIVISFLIGDAILVCLFSLLMIIIVIFSFAQKPKSAKKRKIVKKEW